MHHPQLIKDIFTGPHAFTFADLARFRKPAAGGAETAWDTEFHFTDLGTATLDAQPSCPATRRNDDFPSARLGLTAAFDNFHAGITPLVGSGATVTLPAKSVTLEFLQVRG